MQVLLTLFWLYLPWFYALLGIYFCFKMLSWVRQRKAAALAFGIFFQMVLPDPKAQITIEAVVERKQEVKKQQDGNATPDEDPD